MSKKEGVKMNNNKIKTSHVEQDAPEMGVIVSNSQNTQTAPARDSVNQFPGNGQAPPAINSVNQFSVNGQTPPAINSVNQFSVNGQTPPAINSVNQFSVNAQAAPAINNVNQFPVNGLSLGNNHTALSANSDTVHSESRPQPQGYGVHYQSSGPSASSESEMPLSGTCTAGSYPHMNIQQTPKIEPCNQAWQTFPEANHNPGYGNISSPMHSSYIWPQVPQAANQQLYGDTQPHNVGPHAPQAANQQLYGNTRPQNVGPHAPQATGNQFCGNNIPPQMHGINAWPQVPQHTAYQFYGNNIPPQMHGMNSGPCVAQNAMYEGAVHHMDTVQDKSLIAQPFIGNATAYAQPQYYQQQDTHSGTVSPTNTPSVNEPVNEARPIDEPQARSDVAPEGFFQSVGNMNNPYLPNVENTSEDGNKTKPTTTDAVTHTAPQQQKKKATSSVASRRHTKLVRVPQPQPNISEPGIEADVANNTDERNGIKNEKMDEHDQHANNMADKGENIKATTDVCPICKQTFHDHEMQIHLHECKKSGSRRQVSFKCAYCKQQFNKEYVFDRHLITKHPKEKMVKEMLQQKIPCADCDETFQSEALKIRHRVTAHKIKEKKTETFKCATCSKEFAYRPSLRKHMDLHLPEKIHKCEYCGKNLSM